MPLLFDTVYPWYIVVETVCFFVSFVCSICCGVSYLQMRRGMKKTNESKRKILLIQTCTCVSALLFFLFGSLIIGVKLEPNQPISDARRAACNAFTRTSVLFYCCAAWGTFWVMYYRAMAFWRHFEVFQDVPVAVTRLNKLLYLFTAACPALFIASVAVYEGVMLSDAAGTTACFIEDKHYITVLILVGSLSLNIGYMLSFILGVTKTLHALSFKLPSESVTASTIGNEQRARTTVMIRKMAKLNLLLSVSALAVSIVSYTLLTYAFHNWTDTETVGFRYVIVVTVIVDCFIKALLTLSVSKVWIPNNWAKLLDVCRAPQDPQDEYTEPSALTPVPGKWKAPSATTDTNSKFGTAKSPPKSFLSFNEVVVSNESVSENPAQEETDGDIVDDEGSVESDNPTYFDII